jgi:hypothetical protein
MLAVLFDRSKRLPNQKIYWFGTHLFFSTVTSADLSLNKPKNDSLERVRLEYAKILRK